MESQPTGINEYYQNLGIINIESGVDLIEGYSRQCEGEVEFLKRISKDENILEILEIGFNGGHSSDTFLSNNKNSKVTSFDLGVHEYVKLGKKYINDTYPGRHTLILGDSRVTIPEFIEKNGDKKFDLIFIDGVHEDDVPISDLLNCRKLAHTKTILIMDDTKKEGVNSWNIKPNEAWEYCKKSNFVTEHESFDFSEKHGLSYGRYNLCEVFVCTLLTENRKKYIDKNMKKFPFLKIFKSVNGFNTYDTISQLDKLRLKYINLDFKTYGTLANWLTKYKILVHQIENNIPYMCFIEDDVILSDNFYNYINEAIAYLKDDINILRLMDWGEGYITSLESAKRLVNILYTTGIIKNIDNQLRENSGKEMKMFNCPMILEEETNSGDCLKTLSLPVLKNLVEIEENPYSEEQISDVKRILDNYSKNNNTIIMELGFNAGKMTEVLLNHSQTISIVSMDAGLADYPKIAKSNIDKTFPNRHFLVYGDTRVVLPSYIEKTKLIKFDVIFIDGSRGEDLVKQEIDNCRKIVHKDSIIILDNILFTKDSYDKNMFETSKLWKKELKDNRIFEIGRKYYSKNHGMAWGKFIKFYD